MKELFLYVSLIISDQQGMFVLDIFDTYFINEAKPIWQHGKMVL